MPTGTTAVTAAVEALPFGVATTDADGSITWANAVYALLAGCTPGDLVEQSAGEFDWDALAHAAPSSEPYRGRTVCQQKSGDVCSVEHSITTLRNPTGEVTGFWLMKRDITGLKRQPGVMCEAEASLSALIESTDDLIGSFNLEYKLLTFNKALQASIKSSIGVQATVGMRPDEWIPPERVALWIQMFDRAVSEGSFREEYALLDGRILELSFSPILDDGKTTGISVFGKNITERKRAEEALQQAEIEYRGIFENAVEGIYRTSPEGKGLAANPALARMLGYESVAEGMSMVSDVASQVWLDPCERVKFLHLLETHEIVRNYECQLKRKDGTAVWVSINGRKVCGPDGQMVYTEGFVEDITERRAAEKRLQAQGKRFQDIIEHTDAGYFRIGTGGCFENVNPAWLRMHGFTRKEDIIGLHFSAVHIPEDVAEAQEIVETLMRGEARRGELSTLRQDGTIGYQTFSANPVLDGDRVAGLEGFLVDITAWKTAEEEKRRTLQRANEAVAKAEAHYRLMFNAVSDAVFVHKFGEDGVPSHFIEVNDNACRLLGYTREELLQMRVVDIIAPEEQFNVSHNAKRLLADGSVIWNGLLAAGDGRRIPVEVNARVFSLDSSQTIISSVRDISERKRAEEGARRAENQYRSIFENALEGLYRTTRQGISLAANPALARMLGYDSAHELVTTITDTTSQLWLDPKERSHLFELLTEHEVVRGYECQFKRKDGTPLWVSVNIRTVRGEDELTAYYDGFIEDISGRKESEKRYQEIFEGAVEGIYRTLPEGKLLAANPAFTRMVGYNSATDFVFSTNDTAHQVWLDPDGSTPK